MAPRGKRVARTDSDAVAATRTSKQMKRMKDVPEKVQQPLTSLWAPSQQLSPEFSAEQASTSSAPISSHGEEVINVDTDNSAERDGIHSHDEILQKLATSGSIALTPDPTDNTKPRLFPKGLAGDDDLEKEKSDVIAIQDAAAEAVQQASSQGATFTAEVTSAPQFKPGLNKRDKTLAERLQEAIQNEDGDIDVRGALGQKMMRDMTAAEKADYMAQSHAVKKAIRQTWTRGKLKTLTIEHTYEESWRKVDIQRGTYMSAARIFHKEGGTSDDLEPSIRHVRRCAAMGYPFCKWNDWSGRYDFLWFSTEWQEEMTKSWAIYQRYQAERGNMATSAAPPRAPAIDGPALLCTINVSLATRDVRAMSCPRVSTSVVYIGESNC